MKWFSSAYGEWWVENVENVHTIGATDRGEENRRNAPRFDRNYNTIFMQR